MGHEASQEDLDHLEKYLSPGPRAVMIRLDGVLIRGCKVWVEAELVGCDDGRITQAICTDIMKHLIDKFDGVERGS